MSTVGVLISKGATTHRTGDGFTAIAFPLAPVIGIGSRWGEGKPSALARPAREFQDQHRNPMLPGTREQGGLSFLPSSGCAVNRGHEVARIGGRCARGCEVPPLSNCGGGAL